MTGRAESLLRWLQRVLLLTAVVCLTWYAADYLRVRWYQQEQGALLARAIEATATARARSPQLPADNVRVLPAVHVDTSNAASTPLLDADPNLIGRIDIPAVGVSAIVRTGDDSSTLAAAVGHLPGTARPGEAGNVAVAAHRDTFFRGLRNIRNGHEIRIVTAGGEYLYRVTRTFVVDPQDVWVLDTAGTNTLTLVTCYPFNYIGSAPRRFVVRADEVSSPPRAVGPAVAVAQASAWVPHDIELPRPVVPPPASVKAAAYPRTSSRQARTRVRRRAAGKSAAAPAPAAPAAQAALQQTEGPPRKASAFKRGVGKVFRPFKVLFGKRQKEPNPGSP